VKPNRVKSVLRAEESFPAVSTPDAAPETVTERFYLFTSLGILLVNAVLHTFAWANPGGQLWGVHHYAFFPLTILILSVASLLVLAAVITVRRGAVEGITAWPAKWRSLALWQRGLGLAGLAAVAVAVFWSLRTRHLFLGDGFAIVDALPGSQGFHPLEPLAVELQQLAYQWLAPVLGAERAPYLVAWDAAAWASVLAGAVFAPLLLGVAREMRLLGRTRTDADTGLTSSDVLLFLVLLAQGYVQLFFGYVEIYAIYSVGIALYLLLALRHLNGRAPLWPAAASLALCLGLHLSAAVLLPSLVLLFAMGLWKRATRRGVLRDAAIGTAAFVTIGAGLAWLGDGYNLPTTLWQTGVLALTSKQETIPDYLLSPMHCRDFLNAQLLIGPLALAFFLPAALWTVARWRSVSPAAAFLVVAGVSYFGACAVAGDSNLGYARNWDLIAPAALVFSVAGLGLFVMQVDRVRTVKRVLAVGLAISLFHTVPWVAVNASSERALDRFFTLPLGMGRVESTVGYWFAIQERFDLAEQWLIRSVQENPANVRAHALLGDIYLYRGEYERATVAYTEASRIRPDIRIFRLRLIDASARCGQLESAAFELRVLLEREPDQAGLWAALGIVLAGSGEMGEAEASLEKAAGLDPAAYGGLPALVDSDDPFLRLMRDYWAGIFGG
jgi:hypothetical protein